MKEGLGHLESLPTILQVELSSACNLKCTICARNEFPYGPGNLPLPFFKSLTPIFPHLERLILHGYGEPMAHPEFVEIMEIVAPFTCHKSLYTNGTLLNNNNIRAILDGGMSEITVSIDSPKREDFEAIRVGASFDTVVKGVRKLIELREEEGKNHPEIVIAAVAMDDNIDDLPSLVELASNLGADAIEVNYLMAYKKALIGRSLYFDRARSNEALMEVERRAKSLRLETRLPDLFDIEGSKGHKNPSLHDEICPRPYDFSYIGYDGNVRPCCFPLLYLGSISDVDFLDIWNNEKYQNLRRAFASGNPPAFCRECLSGTYTNVDHEKCHISCEIA